MTVPSPEQIAGQLEKAYQALDDAEETLTDGRLETATSRAYYAIFYAARAILWSQGFAPKTHKGLGTLFDQHLIKPGIVDRVYRDILKDAADDREYADYLALTGSLDVTDVKRLVTDARRFVEKMDELIDEREPGKHC